MISSRSGSQGNASAPPQSVEAVRRRARHRLIGASVLVLVGVIGFPLLFDTQPRPIPVDIPIDIPSRNTPVAAVPAPKAAPAPAPVAAPAPAPVPAQPAAAPEPKPEPPPEPRPEPKPVPAPPAAAAAEAARAEAILQGKPAPDAAASDRFVVQVGAFADEARAREVRQKLERAGLKTYTHVAQTAEGRRIRVRLGPYTTRADAEKAAARVKSLSLSAAILTL